MGTTYSNITLKGPKAQDILQELANQGRSAFIAPTEDDLTTVYEMDSDEGEPSVLMDLAEDLSGYFGCPALAVQITAEEFLHYWLYADGELLDAYTSPDPDSDGPEEDHGGKPELLAHHFNTNVTREELAEILHCPDQDCGVALAADRHLGLVELLDLPLHSAGFGFCDLDSGEYPEDLDEEDLLRVNID